MFIHWEVLCCWNTSCDSFCHLKILKFIMKQTSCSHFRKVLYRKENKHGMHFMPAPWKLALYIRCWSTLQWNETLEGVIDYGILTMYPCSVNIPFNKWVNVNILVTETFGIFRFHAWINRLHGTNRNSSIAKTRIWAYSGYSRCLHGRGLTGILPIFRIWKEYSFHVDCM